MTKELFEIKLENDRRLVGYVSGYAGYTRVSAMFIRGNWCWFKCKKVFLFKPEDIRSLIKTTIKECEKEVGKVSEVDKGRYIQNLTIKR